MYIKSKHADFPKSLLQQFNFQRAKEIAPAKESEEAETEGESEEKQQQEKEAAEDDEEEEEAESEEEDTMYTIVCLTHCISHNAL